MNENMNGNFYSACSFEQNTEAFAEPYFDTEAFSELLEQESRRYSRRLEEEEEARVI